MYSRTIMPSTTVSICHVYSHPESSEWPPYIRKTSYITRPVSPKLVPPPTFPTFLVSRAQVKSKLNFSSKEGSMRTEVLEESTLVAKLSLFGGDCVRVSGTLDQGQQQPRPARAQCQDMAGGCGLQCSLSGPADNSVSYILHLKIFLCLNQIRVHVVPATKETVTYTHMKILMGIA